jgi:WD40 repeat protein
MRHHSRLLQVVVRNLVSKKQVYLTGLSSTISCLVISHDGSLVAAGQTTHMGFVADVIVWRFGSEDPGLRLSLHKGSVECVAFSSSKEYLVSVGGRDDRQVAIWNADTGSPICSVQGHTDTIRACRFLNNTNTSFLTCGVQHVKVWALDSKNKLSSEQVTMGSLKRTFTTISVSSNDGICYCGTQSGDLVEIDLKSRIQKRQGPLKTSFPCGIVSSSLIPNGDLIVGTGTGTIAKIALSSLRVIKQETVCENTAITSLTLTPDGTHMFAGTDSGNIYLVNSDSLSGEIRATSLTRQINAISFPHNMSDIFAVASMSIIKLWNTKSKQEILTIEVPQMECFCLDFSLDGKSIISGWSDGKIRSFTPQTGKLLYAIEDAHKEGVTAIRMLTDCARVVSGGMKGDIRIWKLSKSHQELVASLKEHKGRIWSLVIRTDDNARAVSACADGSVIVWDLEKRIRLVCIFESTMFKAVVYYPDFSQIVTVGTDRRLTYYDVFDGEALRILEGDADVISASKSGSHLAVAGRDGRLRLIDYDQGTVSHSGEGHSVGVTAIAVAPNQEYIVTGDEQGALFFWNLPNNVREKFAS